MSRGSLRCCPLLQPDSALLEIRRDQEASQDGGSDVHVVVTGLVVDVGGNIAKFPAGDFQVPCALIIGQRKESTDLKTSLNNALREYDVAV